MPIPTSFMEYVNNAGRRIPIYTFRTPDEPRTEHMHRCHGGGRPSGSCYFTTPLAT